MGPRAIPAVRRSMTFRKVIDAPLEFVFRWCTDYRDDDDRITDDIYHYRADIVLREPRRIVRVITVPGADRNRSTEVEVIRMFPPDRWSLQKLSLTDDKQGRYRLRRLGPAQTVLEMRFTETWRLRKIPSRERYRRLFHRVWDRYVERLEAEHRQRFAARARAPPNRLVASERQGSSRWPNSDLGPSGRTTGGASQRRGASGRPARRRSPGARSTASSSRAGRSRPPSGT
jgi:hypothetical protein